MTAKCYLEKSYISAYKVDKSKDFCAITSNKPTYSIRYHHDDKDDYCLFLSNSYNLCNKYNIKNNFKNCLNNIPSKAEYIWSNKDIITYDNMPFIGSLRKKDNSLLIATGYNTWGMTNGTIAGKILSDIILNKENKYIALFDPNRLLNISSLLKFPLNISSSVKAMITSKVNKNKSWYSPNVKFINKNGTNLGIYIDKKGKEHIVVNNCPHLKCSLIFNEIEKTWDCPCHGSRFDLDGNPIEGPTNYNIKYK